MSREQKVAISMAGCAFVIAAAANPAIAQYVIHEGPEWVRHGESGGVYASFYISFCACIAGAVACFAAIFAD